MLELESLNDVAYHRDSCCSGDVGDLLWSMTFLLWEHCLCSINANTMQDVTGDVFAAADQMMTCKPGQ